MDLLSVLLLAALAGLFAAHVLRTASRSSLLKKTVTVHTKDGQSVRGVLLKQRSDEWVLTSYAVVHAEGLTELEGDLHIPRANIAFAQHLEASA